MLKVTIHLKTCHKNTAHDPKERVALNTEVGAD